MHLSLAIPDGYPGEPTARPTVLGASCSWLSASQCDALARAAGAFLASAECPEDECLFPLVQHMGDRAAALAAPRSVSAPPASPPATPVDPASATVATASAEAPAAPAPRPCRSITGPTITDRKSRFVAHAAPCRTIADVAAFRAHILSDKRVACATHNILAYRLGALANGRDAPHEGRDDDGEAKAGDQLLELLQRLRVTDVAVLVTRWFGGVQLGPDRFRHIVGCARALLLAAGLVPGREGEADPTCLAALNDDPPAARAAAPAARAAAPAASRRAA